MTKSTEVLDSGTTVNSDQLFTLVGWREPMKFDIMNNELKLCLGSTLKFYDFLQMKWFQNNFHKALDFDFMT